MSDQQIEPRLKPLDSDSGDIFQSPAILDNQRSSGGCMRRMASIAFLLSALGLFAETITLGMNPQQLFDKGMNALTGTGPSRSDVQALDYFRRAADSGFVPAQDVLGYFYESGTITAANPRQAAEWYRKAATQDDAIAQWRLGQLIFHGDLAFRDLNGASQLLDKSAGHGNPFAQLVLGQLKLERGDYAAAAISFDKAAHQGLPQAQQQLGLLFKQGKGMNEDKRQAYVWLLVSLDSGNESVAADLQQLEAELGSRLTEQAKSEARELEKSVARAVVSRGCTGWRGEFDSLPSPPPPDLQRFCH
jgi:uncharacterized protein